MLGSSSRRQGVSFNPWVVSYTLLGVATVGCVITGSFFLMLASGSACDEQNAALLNLMPTGRWMQNPGDGLMRACEPVYASQCQDERLAMAGITCAALPFLNKALQCVAQCMDDVMSPAEVKDYFASIPAEYAKDLTVFSPAEMQQVQSQGQNLIIVALACMAAAMVLGCLQKSGSACSLANIGMLWRRPQSEQSNDLSLHLMEQGGQPSATKHGLSTSK